MLIERLPMPETPPVRRGPGRPRKVQATEPVKPDPEPEVEPEVEAGPPPSDPDDERIGQSCNPDWAVVAFSDTDRMYRCENGVIVERLR
jgi:hypothetical protein